MEAMDGRECGGAPGISRVRSVVFLVLSLGMTAGIFGYLLTRVNLGDVLDLLRNVDLWAVGMFLVLSFAMSVFRAWRYQVTLEASGFRPPALPLFLVVLVRNFCSDLLPARIGTLVYIYLATTRLGVPVAVATSSYSLSFVFDFIALAPLIVLAVLGAGVVTGLSSGAMLAGALVLAAVTVAMLFLLEPGFRWAARVCAAIRLRGLARYLGDSEAEMKRARKAGVYGRLLVLSMLVRIGKYGSLYVFLFALLHPLGYTWDQLSPSRVFLGLCASELAASLPISGIAGFGAYEGAWALVFTLLGFPRPVAELTSISHHLFTQVYGYSLGGVALLLLMLPFFRVARPPVTPAGLRRPVLGFALRLSAVCVAFAVTLGGLAVLPSLAGGGGVKADAADTPSPAERAARTELAKEIRGEIVFDSTRSGTFGIWAMRPDGSGLRAVSDTPEHELYPDPSPDGRRVVFARTASLSKNAPSEIWVVPAAGGGGRKLAADGTFPTFSADGRTVWFERGRRKLMAADVASGEVREVFPGPAKDFRDAVVKPRVSADGRQAVFISNRGKGGGWKSWTADLRTGEVRMVGPGCEPGWMPDGRVVWVSEDGGRERTGIFVSDANTGKIETLQDDDAPRGHEYFPTVTAEGRRLFWSACRPGQHAHTDFGSNYQIFSRRLPDGKPVRITFDGFNNRWPKLLNAAPVAP